MRDEWPLPPNANQIPLFEQVPYNEPDPEVEAITTGMDTLSIR